MNIIEAKQALDRVIEKARIHLYKPIQIAEILHRDRCFQDIDLSLLETYRNSSKKWRDAVCLDFLGRTSTSSARYQDDLFNENATPPAILSVLGAENRAKGGAVEAYIYKRFNSRFGQINSVLDYCKLHSKEDFDLETLLNMFWEQRGLRRSVDKIYEIVVYSLFSALVEALDINVEVSINRDRIDILSDFEDFASKVIALSSDNLSVKLKAKINRVGVTNAADRGLDMWANFGMAIQIKHLSLTEELAENIVSSLSADRVVIVCRDSEQRVILSLLNQIGWRSRIQSVITESDLLSWYDRALRGKYADEIGSNIIKKIIDEIGIEFPSTGGDEFSSFYRARGYHNIHDDLWTKIF